METHYTGDGYCPKVSKFTPRGEYKGQSPGQKSNTARLRKIDREEDGNNTDQDYTDTEGENHIHFNKDRTICSRFTLIDISGTEIEICGYVDIEMNTVGGEEDFKQTRILIVAGTATTVIL